MMPIETIQVCAFYKFIPIKDLPSLRETLLQDLRDYQIKGTIIIAEEGINGTISGEASSMQSLINTLQQRDQIGVFEYKISITTQHPFYRTKVKIKKEIVTMGRGDLNPAENRGTYVKAADWNALLADPEVLLIDTRNDYEVEIGRFKGAQNPNTQTFRSFPDYVEQHLDRNKHRKIAMYCTGGIRCEKSTAYLKSQGFEHVYHLEGGILKYLEQVPESESLWQGECFVFDNRVTVNHQLQAGEYDQCHACRRPLSEQDKLSSQYAKGVSCPRCCDKKSPEQQQRYREREKQMNLAAKRGKVHIGSDGKTIGSDGKTIADKKTIKNN